MQKLLTGCCDSPVFRAVGRKLQSVPDEPFPVEDVSDWVVDGNELGGVDEKIWLQEPVTDRLWLFKPVPVEQGFTRGEDWAEKAVAHLAEDLGVP